MKLIKEINRRAKTEKKILLHIFICFTYVLCKYVIFTCLRYAYILIIFMQRVEVYFEYIFYNECWNEIQNYMDECFAPACAMFQVAKCHKRYPKLVLNRSCKI